MKNTITALLLTTAPIFAGEPAPMIAPAPAPCDCPQGWTIGLEAMAMKAYPGYTPGDSDTDYEFAGRASIGYEFGDCMFVKATGFWFGSDLYDDTETDGTNTYEYSGDVDMSYYDLVVGQHFTPGDKAVLSAYVGLRYAVVDRTDKERYTYVGEGSFSDTYKTEADWDGLGIVVGVDGTRSLGNSFSLYGTAKQSVLFGSTDFSGSGGMKRIGDGSSDGSSDDVVFISELGLGVQYDFAFSNVAANVRLGVEGQYWTGGSGYYSDGDIGLAGFVLGANFRF